MQVTPKPRVQMPFAASMGEVIPVHTLISHAMETGLRHDAQGAVIPRDIINSFTCHYDEQLVFSADLHEAVAANPYLEFYVRATHSGRLRFAWRADDGAVYTLEHGLTVT